MFLKRLFDLVISSIGLLILLPLLFIVAIWIKFDSKGPVFFRQVRIGLNGKPFRIYKFRTMFINTEKQGGLTIGQDNRITRAGRFLRKYKIDELAQLIDVFRGTMSLVGPRPEIPEFIALYDPSVRSKILSVRPGITDKASIEMIDENEILGKYSDPQKAYVNIIMPIKAKYYCEYVDNLSIKNDLLLIFATIKKLIFRV